jgi:hypothetical protein
LACSAVAAAETIGSPIRKRIASAIATSSAGDFVYAMAYPSGAANGLERVKKLSSRVGRRQHSPIKLHLNRRGVIDRNQLEVSAFGSNNAHCRAFAAGRSIGWGVVRPYIERADLRSGHMVYAVPFAQVSPRHASCQRVGSSRLKRSIQPSSQGCVRFASRFGHPTLLRRAAII